jgi:hypothetical protein
MCDWRAGRAICRRMLGVGAGTERSMDGDHARAHSECGHATGWASRLLDLPPCCARCTRMAPAPNCLGPRCSWYVWQSERTAARAELRTAGSFDVRASPRLSDLQDSANQLPLGRRRRPRQLDMLPGAMHQVQGAVIHFIASANRTPTRSFLENLVRLPRAMPPRSTTSVTAPRLPAVPRSDALAKRLDAGMRLVPRGAHATDLPRASFQ